MSNKEFNRDEIRAMRLSYGQAGIGELNADPFLAFGEWLREAHGNPIIVEANAMVLSTVDSEVSITTRSVLLKDISQGGFTFFTNYSSRKAHSIELNPGVSLLFPWYPLERQVIVIGSASKVSKEESEKYFASRPRGSQIGAWASAQSTELSSRAELEEKFANFEAKWPIGEQIPRPDFWGGYVVKPESIEFWQGRYSRLHDRIRYVKEDNNWHLKRLNP